MLPLMLLLALALAPAASAEDAAPVVGPARFAAGVDALLAELGADGEADPDDAAPDDSPERDAADPPAIRGPAAFSAGVDALLAELEGGDDPGDEDVPWESFEESPATTRSLAEQVGGAEGAADPAGILDQLGFSRRQVDHQLQAGSLDTVFRSAIDGRVTTESRFLQHTFSVQEAIGDDVDVTIENVVKFDRLNDRNDFVADIRRQVDVEHFWNLGAGFSSYRAKGDPTEPDYDQKEFSFGGGKDGFPDASFDFRVYGRDLEYEGTDPFYLDTQNYGLELNGAADLKGTALDLYVLVERERFESAPENDVNRKTRNLGLSRTIGGFDLRLGEAFNRETVFIPGNIDPYSEWLRELTVGRRISPVFAAQVARSFLKREVDTLSAFLYDGRERGRRAELAITPGGGWSGNVRWYRAELRNIDKDPRDATLESQDDQDRREFEATVSYARGKFDASVTRLDGRIEYVNGQSSAFANQEREELSIRVGWQPDERWRVEAWLTRYQEDYRAFRENDNASDSLGLTITRDF